MIPTSVRLQELLRRSQRQLGLAAVTGAIVGLGVAAFEWLTNQQIYERLLEAPLAVQAAAPAVGLALAALALRFLAGGAGPGTADEYIKNFHEPARRLDVRPVFGRLLAGLATLGSGGALGYEGPSLYLGAAVGTRLQQRWSKRFSAGDAKVLMVAGAAAGVAAIFKAPATGAVFALEVPYQDDTAHRMLLPALMASVTSYLVFVTIVGTTPLFEVKGSPPFDLRDLGGALVLGIVCGVGARLFSLMIRRAKQLAGRGHPAVRVVAAGAGMAVLFVASYAVFGEGVSNGPGYGAIERVADPNISLQLLLALLAFRIAANAFTLAGGGVGGLFIPLVVAGAIVGRIAAGLVGDPNTTVFPLIGVAAFLGAGYRTPLAGVVFVAESTGRAGFVVPGVIASVVAQVLMGNESVSGYQRKAAVLVLEDGSEQPVSIGPPPEPSPSRPEAMPPATGPPEEMTPPPPPVEG